MLEAEVARFRVLLAPAGTIWVFRPKKASTMAADIIEDQALRS
jgi:hypothetical protein